MGEASIEMLRQLLRLCLVVIAKMIPWCISIRMPLQRRLSVNMRRLMGLMARIAILRQHGSRVLVHRVMTVGIVIVLTIARVLL